MLRLIKFLMPVVLSALLVALSFSSFNAWMLSWFGFIPLFFVLNNQSKAKAFLAGFSWGFIFWSFTIYWLAHVTLPGTVTLIFYLSIYSGIFGALFSFASLRRVPGRLFFIPSLWVCLEYLRSYLFTGFPWAILAHSQYTNLPMIQISDLSGSWGVSFLIILVNYSLYLALARPRKQAAFGLILTAAVFLCCLFYGYNRLGEVEGEIRKTTQKTRISVIQANIPQELKWDEYAAGYILQSYKGLTQEASLDAPELIIWPEAAAPGLFGKDAKLFEDIFALARVTKSNLLLGAVSRIGDEYFNSALFVGQDGKLSGVYHKLHLVPFGEYIPLKNVFPFLETVVPIGDISPGREYTIFEKPAKFGVLICFEDLFPELSREFVKRGALFLVNITNDAWYKQSSASYQHFAASVFRSVENKVYLVRAANTGISGFISPAGRIISRVSEKGKLIFVPGFKTENIYPVAGPATFYNRYGDYFVYLCLLFVICGIIQCFLSPGRQVN